MAATAIATNEIAQLKDLTANDKKRISNYFLDKPTTAQLYNENIKALEPVAKHLLASFINKKNKGDASKETPKKDFDY